MKQTSKSIKMKKTGFTLLFAFAFIFAFSQQVDRDMVILEIGTGTWCVYCPGAAQGADDLVDNGHDVAVIEYHDGGSDPYATPQSEYRSGTYYGISSFPTAKFDGTLTEVGGGVAGTSKYNDYLPLYNQRIVIPCSFTIDVCGEENGGTYDVTVTLEKVASYTGTNLKAHLVLTESEIAYSWQGMSELNFVCRKMYPDSAGTSVDFSSNSVIEINYTFTPDGSWNTDHCELVAFIQDDDNQEILQGTKVALPDLIGCAPVAAISCDDTSICVGGNAQFHDNSTGNVVSREWTFDGGSPATSTDPDPVVNYDSDGYYDVELIVTDGTNYDTSYQTNYIEVKTDPSQCSKPTGTHHACMGQGNKFRTESIIYAENYLWEVDPPEAGTISGTDTTGTYHPASGYSGDYSIRVRAENECNDGAWSDTIYGTVTPSPVAQDLSPGGSYCEGGDGIELKLYGSETGFDYELYFDDEPTGNIVAGTGDTISFGYQTDEGIYTAVGYNTYCTTDMIGSAWIHIETEPAQAEQPSGPEETCSNDTSVYVTEEIEGADTLIWTIDPAEAGEVIETVDEEATIAWSPAYSGSANVSVAGENDCGTGEQSEPLEVNLLASPQPVVTGLNEVCEGDQHVYSTQNHQDNTYEWSVDNGTIMDGSGTHEVTIQWHNPGYGYVSVTETNSDGCIAESDTLEVTINECTGMDQMSAGNVNIYPNPTSGDVFVEFRLESETRYNIRVLNATGQLVYSQSEKSASETQKIKLNTATLQNGYYLISIETNDGSGIQKKFIKH